VWLVVALCIFTGHNFDIDTIGKTAIQIFLILSHNLAASILGCCHFKHGHIILFYTVKPKIIQTPDLSFSKK